MPKTVGKYRFDLTRFITFVKERKDHKRLRPADTTPADFKAFKKHLEEVGLSDGTIGDYLTIVKQAFKWAATEAKPRLLAENPIADEKIDEAEDGPQPCFTPEQVALLLAKADAHHRPIWAVMAYLGLRVGEVRDLLWSDFNFGLGKHGWVHVQRGGSIGRNGTSKTTKGKKSRRIPLNKELRNILLGLPHHADGRVFHQQPSKKYPDGGRPLNNDRLLKSLKRLCKRCGFDNPTQYKLHTYRHVFASMLAMTNVSYKYALEFMGHKDSKILDLYYKMYDRAAESAIAEIEYKLAPPVIPVIPTPDVSPPQAAAG